MLLLISSVLNLSVYVYVLACILYLFLHLHVVGLQGVVVAQEQMVCLCYDYYVTLL